MCLCVLVGKEQLLHCVDALSDEWREPSTEPRNPVVSFETAPLCCDWLKGLYLGIRLVGGLCLFVFCL